MYRRSRAKLLEDLALPPSIHPHPVPRRCEYIEAFKSRGRNVFRRGLLGETQIEDWVRQSGNYSLPAPLNDMSEIEGGIRLVMIERTSTDTMGFSISREAYELIEDVFRLSESTLKSFSNYLGVCSQSMSWRPGNPPIPACLKITVKANQKRSLANYGLSMCYDYQSSMTTAIFCGRRVLRERRPDEISFNVPAADVQAHIEASPDLWLSPLFLPFILVSDYVDRLTTHASLNHKRIVIGEARLGVSKAGRLQDSGKSETYGPILTRETDFLAIRNMVGDLLESLGTLLTEVVYLDRCGHWSTHAAQFLRSSLSDFRRHREPSTGNESAEDIADTVAYLESEVANVSHFIATLKERVQLQINILHSFIAQNDNRLNAKMAAAASRDGMAMKVLAFITAVFLPGTFIATIFSMGMFNWPIQDAATVSSKFWVFWAISIPLTFVVIAGWWFWWKWERERFDRVVGNAVDTTSQGTWSSKNGHP